jgi:hypothetical protein
MRTMTKTDDNEQDVSATVTPTTSGTTSRTVGGSR